PEQIMAWAPDDIDRQTTAIRNLAKPTWVAEVEKLLVGFADLEPTGHLDRLFVHADYQRQGVGSVLLSRVETAAKERGLKRLSSEVSITALAFFTHRDFRIVCPQTVTVRGQQFLNYRMEKNLDSK
ncbi:MAG: GNAT family N-acetyltransferase, partial [Rhizomicrobium sp.]